MSVAGRCCSSPRSARSPLGRWPSSSTSCTSSWWAAPASWSPVCITPPPPPPLTPTLTLAIRAALGAAAAAALPPLLPMFCCSLGPSPRMPGSPSSSAWSSSGTTFRRVWARRGEPRLRPFPARGMGCSRNNWCCRLPAPLVEAARLWTSSEVSSPRAAAAVAERGWCVLPRGWPPSRSRA